MTDHAREELYMPRRARRALEATDGIGRVTLLTFDNHPVWNVPGPPWGRTLCWRGPGEPLHHFRSERPGWRGEDTGPVTKPCHTHEEAQAAADAWWLAQPECGGGLW
jgi:hypothetical protein